MILLLSLHMILSLCLPCLLVRFSSAFQARIPTIIIARPSHPLSSSSSSSASLLFLGLYDDDEIIDWDADLFSQITGQKTSESVANTATTPAKDAATSNNNSLDAKTNYDNNDDDDVWKWDTKSNQTKNLSSYKSSMDSMRREMKQAWGGSSAENNDKVGGGAAARKEEEGKPTADWMPNFGKGPDDDEPWFTG